MKKTIKLWFTVINLCFVLAILCFGVFASVTVSYTVSGNIHYEVDRAFVEITTKIYSTQAAMNKSELTTSAAALENKNFEEIESTLGKPVQTFDTYNNTENTGSSTINGVDIDYNKSFTYYIVINVKNLSLSNSIDLSLENNVLGDGNSVTYTTPKKFDIENSQNGTNIIIAYSLDDLDQSIDNVQFSYTVNIDVSSPSYTVTINVNVLGDPSMRYFSGDVSWTTQDGTGGSFTPDYVTNNFTYTVLNVKEIKIDASCSRGVEINNESVGTSFSKTYTISEDTTIEISLWSSVGSSN